SKGSPQQKLHCDNAIEAQLSGTPNHSHASRAHFFNQFIVADSFDLPILRGARSQRLSQDATYAPAARGVGLDLKPTAEAKATSLIWCAHLGGKRKKKGKSNSPSTVLRRKESKEVATLLDKVLFVGHGLLDFVTNQLSETISSPSYRHLDRCFGHAQPGRNRTVRIGAFVLVQNGLQCFP